MTDLPPSNAFVLHGVRHHTLGIEEISLQRNIVTVLTGVSGSGKSSLAFDTIYAYGFLQYLESLSAYARRNLPKLAPPDVDWVSGLTPTVAIEQKTISRNPRSTVGSLTEIGDRLRLLMARAGIHSCASCGAEARPRGAAEHVAWIEKAGPQGLSLHDDSGAILAGADAQAGELLPIIDRALHRGERLTVRRGTDVVRYVLAGWSCAECGTASEETSSSYFTPNSPHGMCHTCQGLGAVTRAVEHTLVADPELSVLSGALAFYGDRRRSKKTWWPLRELPRFLSTAGLSVETPWKEVPRGLQEIILFGRTSEPVPRGTRRSLIPAGGLAANIERLFADADSAYRRDYYLGFMAVSECPACEGRRLNPRALEVRLGGLNIAEISELPISDLPSWLERAMADLDTPLLWEIGRELIPQLRERFQFLLDVGLHYLTLSRPAPTLSAGEGQRVRLARQLSCGLAGVTYVLDEPSIGLHPSDVQRLIDTIRVLVARDNTAVVVEHDRATLEAADEIVELGPGPGVHGGRVVARGTAEQLRANSDSRTGAYLRGDRTIGLPGRPRPEATAWLRIEGATLHNLKDLTVELAIGRLNCITGVSGSGKSSLVMGSLRPAMETVLRSGAPQAPVRGLAGWQSFDRVLTVTQDTLTGSSRSTPATYIGIFDELRKRFAVQARKQGQQLSASDFSFNASGGGRCGTCDGKGVQRVEMLFLADASVTCPDCQGRRYSPAVMDVRIAGLSIADVLDTEVGEVARVFAEVNAVARPLGMLARLGLGYLKLGQDTASLSGGESQRLKLARELLRSRSGPTLYLIDEPTTGLHFHDIQVLLEVLDQLVEQGHTVVVIEHDPEFVASADWLVDMGPEGGAAGGWLCDAGFPRDVADRSLAKIAPFLRENMPGAIHASA